MCKISFLWSFSLQFPNYLKNLLLRIPSLRGVHFGFKRILQMEVASTSSNSPYEYLMISSFHRSKVLSLDMMILISLWRSRSGSFPFPCPLSGLPLVSLDGYQRKPLLHGDHEFLRHRMRWTSVAILNPMECNMTEVVKERFETLNSARVELNR